MKPIYRVPASIVMQKQEYVWEQICVNDFWGARVAFWVRIVRSWRLVHRGYVNHAMLPYPQRPAALQLIAIFEDG